MNLTKTFNLLIFLIFGFTLLASAQTATYQHNAANQLLEARYAECTIVSYAYDANGNRTERIVQPCPEISGSVLTPDGAAIADVVLTGLPGSPKTDGAGFYRVKVQPGWSGAVVPQKTDYTFTPVNRTYANLTVNQTEQNYIGVLPQYTLTVQIVGSGAVSDDNGLNCPDACTQTVDKHTIVTFSAVPAAGYILDSVTNAECSETGGNCVVTITQDTTVVVTFIADPTITPTPIITPTPGGTPTVIPTPTPEPGMFILFGLGLLGLFALKRRIKKN